MSMSNTEKPVKDIHRNARGKFFKQGTMCRVLEVVGTGGSSVGAHCHNEDISLNLYCRWRNGLLAVRRALQGR